MSTKIKHQSHSDSHHPVVAFSYSLLCYATLCLSPRWLTSLIQKGSQQGDTVFDVGVFDEAAGNSLRVTGMWLLHAVTHRAVQDSAQP